jgi:hypothetical protein
MEEEVLDLLFEEIGEDAEAVMDRHETEYEERVLLGEDEPPRR